MIDFKENRYMAVRYLQVEIVVRRCSNWIRGVGQEWECARSWLRQRRAGGGDQAAIQAEGATIIPTTCAQLHPQPVDNVHNFVDSQ